MLAFYGKYLTSKHLAGRPGSRLGFQMSMSQVVETELSTTGPVADRLTIWPMDDGRYGLDATFQGASGHERAELHIEQLQSKGVRHSLRQELDGGWTLRFGPLTAADIDTALSAFVY